jgi:hypothetical protein
LSGIFRLHRACERSGRFTSTSRAPSPEVGLKSKLVSIANLEPEICSNRAFYLNTCSPFPSEGPSWTKFLLCCTSYNSLHFFALFFFTEHASFNSIPSHAYSFMRAQARQRSIVLSSLILIRSRGFLLRRGPLSLLFLSSPRSMYTYTFLRRLLRFLFFLFA